MNAIVNAGRAQTWTPPTVATQPFAHVLNDVSAGVAAVTFWFPGDMVVVASPATALGDVTVSADAASLVLVQFLESHPGAITALQVSASTPNTPGLLLHLAVAGVAFDRASGNGCVLSAGGRLSMSLGDNDLVGHSTICTLHIASV